MSKTPPKVLGLKKVKDAENGREPRATIMCPSCKGVGTIDDDQYHGRISIWCDCGYHETHNLAEVSNYG